MNKEKLHLMNMLKDHKISQEDYALLIDALDKKPSRLQVVLSFMTNPFQKIAGIHALAIGLLIMLGMSFLGVIAKIYYLGVFGIVNASVLKNQTIDMNFWVLAYQIAVSWVILSGIFMMTARIFQQKRIRFIDFIGTVALARYPSFILTGFLAVIRKVKPEFLSINLSEGLSLQPSMLMSMVNMVVIICVIWQVTTYFYALKESSGLMGKKLWFGFIAALILADFVAMPLTTFFMN